MQKFWKWGKKTGLGVILGVFFILYWTGQGRLFYIGRYPAPMYNRYGIKENSIDELGIPELNQLIGDGSFTVSADSGILTARSGKTVALTFDDGPHEKWTPLLLDGLEERGVKVTFFLMGENIAGNEEIVQRMSEAGHLIGNHSFRHVQLTKEGMDEVCRAFEKTGDLIEGLTGNRPQYVRPPYGDWNEELECRTNLTTVLWDVDSLDWSYKNRRRVVDKVCREVEDGDIILMHDIFQSSEEAALEIIDRLQAEGWQFVTVDEIMID